MSTLRSRIEARLREKIAEAEAVEVSQGRAEAGKLDLGPLFARLDEVIAVVEQIRDYSVEPYMDKVREIVCSTCRQKLDGTCATRDHHLCGLDKYFHTIVATIERELKNEPGLPA